VVWMGRRTHLECCSRYPQIVVGPQIGTEKRAFVAEAEVMP